MSEMRKFFPIYEETVSHIWLWTRSLLISLYIMKIFFSFLSVNHAICWQNLCVVLKRRRSNNHGKWSRKNIFLKISGHCHCIMFCVKFPLLFSFFDLVVLGIFNVSRSVAHLYIVDPERRFGGVWKANFAAENIEGVVVRDERVLLQAARAVSAHLQLLPHVIA